jgi:hypothetical protein
MRRTDAGKLAFLIPCLVMGLLASSGDALAAARTAPDKFVRTAGYYLKAGIGIPSSDHEALSKYDVLVLPAEAQVFNREMFADLRRRNPDIIILAYVPTKSYALVWNDSLHDDLKGQLRDEWRLRDANGAQLSVWPNTYSLNIAGDWADFLGRWTAEKVLATGLWDGVFYDEASATISWLNGGNLDLDRNGAKDDAATADRLWKAGMTRLFKTTRDLSPSTYIVMNGDSDADLAAYTNGRMFETFPTPWEGNGSWQTVENNYLRLQGQTTQPPIFIINGNTNNTGAKNDFAKMRFGLASALMGDGYFGFDHGDQDHGQLWMYDEYDAYLGRPVGTPRNLLANASTAIRPGLWRRDFEHGVVLVNSTDLPQTADFDGDFERLHGTQDPNVNNGEISNSVEIPAKDGLILLRPLDRIVNASYRNGAFLRILDADGDARRTGFFSYNNKQRGGTILAEFTPTGAGSAVVIAAKNNRIEAYDQAGNLTKTVYPFGESWKTAVGFSIGKVGGKTYIAVAAGAGATPKVRLYSETLEPVTAAWDAYNPRFAGGVNVAVGDVDNDGEPDIITGAGAGGGPHVRVFSVRQEVKAQFFAYDLKFAGGVNIGVGDLDGDGTTEIVTGTGFGGGPQVKVFNRFGQAKKSFFAYDSRKRGGVRVSVTDVDGDGRAEVIAMTNDVFTLAYKR